MRDQRGRDQIEVAQELSRRRVRRQCSVGRPRGHDLRQCARRRSKPGIDARQGLAIRLIATMRVGVVRVGGELNEFGRRRHQAIGQRKFGTEQVHLGEVVGKDQPRLRLAGVTQRLGNHKRIPVPIAADPRPHLEHRRDDDALAESMREAFFQRDVQTRNLIEKGVTIVSEAIVDLVLNLQLGQAQHRRLPECQHLSIQAGKQAVVLVGGQRASIAPLQQAHDLAFTIEDALALHFSRMRSQHRTYQGFVKPCAQAARRDATLAEPLERVRDAAFLRR